MTDMTDMTDMTTADYSNRDDDSHGTTGVLAYALDLYGIDWDAPPTGEEVGLLRAFMAGTQPADEAEAECVWWGTELAFRWSPERQEWDCYL